MFRKTIIALAAVLAVGLAAPTDAFAWRGGHGGGWHGGGWRGGGWGGAGWGLVGLGIGLGLASPFFYGGYGYPYAYPYRYPYGYPYGYGSYYGYGGCYLVRQRVMTRYGWRVRRVQVCD